MRYLESMRSLVLLLPLLCGGCDSDAAADPADARPAHAFDVSGGSDAAVPDPDRIDFACDDPDWAAGACAAGSTEEQAPAGANHVTEAPLEYERHPPATGPHRPRWARWGEYDFLPPQRWLHNLEHGGVAFLYHPCAPAALVDELRAVIRGFPDDDGGPFRWVLTPYVDLPSAVAVVAWGHVYSAECVRADEIGAFVGAHYRRAPEDVPNDGTWDEGWQTR